MTRTIESMRSRDLDASKGRAILRDDIDYLEKILAHNRLLMHAMVNTLMNKGVFTREELLSAMESMDESDGTKDGMLDPESTLPPDERRPKRERGIFDKLRKLDESDLSSPLEFLRKLEEK